MADPENLKDRLKASYDAIAPEYNAWTVAHSPKRMRYLDQLIARLRPTASNDAVALKPLRVLELGCGAGVPATEKMLSALAPVHIDGNDLSSSQIALARKNLGEGNPETKATVTWHEGDMMALSFEDATFDAVVGFYSVIHLPRDEQTTLLASMYRWLKPGGFILANFAGAATDRTVLERWLGRNEGWMYWSGWGVEGTLKRVKEAGFEVVVAEVEEDEVKATFLWLIAEKPE